MLPTEEKNAGFINDEQIQASTDLHHLFLDSTKDSLSGSFGLKVTTHTSDCDLQGKLFELSSVESLHMLAKFEAHERDLALCEQAELATLLLLNSERFHTWALFRRALVDVSRARAAASGADQMRRGVDPNTAMVFDALQQHSVKNTCGRFGHPRRTVAKTTARTREKIPRAKVGKGKGNGPTGGGSGTMSKGGRRRRNRAQLRVNMCVAWAESVQNCETSPPSEIMSSGSHS